MQAVSVLPEQVPKQVFSATHLASLPHAFSSLGQFVWMHCCCVVPDGQSCGHVALVSPASHVPLPQLLVVEPQSAGQVLAVSPASQVPLPQLLVVVAQSAAQLIFVSPASQMPLPHDVVVPPQSAGHVAAVSPVLQNPSPHWPMVVPVSLVVVPVSSPPLIVPSAPVVASLPVVASAPVPVLDLHCAMCLLVLLGSAASRQISLVAQAPADDHLPPNVLVASAVHCIRTLLKQPWFCETGLQGVPAAAALVPLPAAPEPVLHAATNAAMLTASPSS